MSRTVALVAMALALTASRARAQAAGPESHAPNVLQTVTVTAKAPSNNLFHRFWHMNEDRNQVIAMERENRRLAWQLHGYDRCEAEQDGPQRETSHSALLTTSGGLTHACSGRAPPFQRTVEFGTTGLTARAEAGLLGATTCLVSR